MNFIEIKSIAGVDLYINSDAVSYLRTDPADSSRTLVCLNTGEFHTVKLTISDLMKLFSK